MAYRQLCAVTFAVLGLVTVGCGAGTSSRVDTDATEEQPPANADQAPNNAGDAATNPDKAPGNPDSPPSSSEDPAGSGGGGRLTALCDQICATLDTLVNDCNLGLGTGMGGMEQVCSGDVKCQIPADYPCQNEIADTFECLFANLDLICAADEQQGSGPTACRDVSRAFTQCADANEPPDTGGDDGNCTTAGDCKRCANECAACTCEAGTDLTELQACGTGACAAP